MTQWSFPTRIVFGAGEASKVGAEARALGITRVLLVTDPGVIGAGLVDPVMQGLEVAGIPARVFSSISSNPIEAEIEAGAANFAEHQADGLIAMGGGSAIDSAKLIAVRSQTSLSYEELDDARGGTAHVPSELPPVMAIPTTAGTGSEVGRAAVLTVSSTQRKTVIFAPQMLPRLALLDPELSRSLPARITAATGFDALTHCIEAYLAVGDHPMADAIALGGISLVARALPRAFASPEDIEARGDMLKAAMMGAVAFQKGLGACHSLAHPLSSDCGLHHGLANALCLAAVIDFNQEVVPARVHEVGRALGGSGSNCKEQVQELCRQLELPEGLGRVGVTRSQLPDLAAKAFLDGCHRENPRPCDEAALLQLYQVSL